MSLLPHPDVVAALAVGGSAGVEAGVPLGQVPDHEAVVRPELASAGLVHLAVFPDTRHEG